MTVIELRQLLDIVHPNMNVVLRTYSEGSDDDYVLPPVYFPIQVAEIIVVNNDTFFVIE